MKRTILILCLLMQTFISAQELNFNVIFVDAENEYIVLPNKNGDSEFTFGVPYYDAVAGYSFSTLGNFSIKDGKYFKNSTEIGKAAFSTTRVKNLGLNVAILPKNKLKELGLPEIPEFLKFYKYDKENKEIFVDKMSAMNAAGLSNLVLPKLENLHQQKYKSADFYFELAYAYNALGKFDDAENIIEEAAKFGFHDELMIKEKLYALVSQNKTKETSEYLEKNLNNFETKSYLEESIFNLTRHYFLDKDFVNAKKWISIYRKKITDGNYVKNMDKIESEINK